MARTKEQLATAVMRQMGEVEANASPSAADSAFIKGLYDDKIEEWRDRNVVYWSNTGDSVAEIPSVVFQTLVGLLINLAGPTFGKAATLEEQAAREEFLLKSLRRHVARPSTGLPLRVDYF